MVGSTTKTTSRNNARAVTPPKNRGALRTCSCPASRNAAIAIRARARRRPKSLRAARCATAITRGAARRPRRHGSRDDNEKIGQGGQPMLIAQMPDARMGFARDEKPEESHRVRFRATRGRRLARPNGPDMMVVSGGLTDHGDIESFE